MPGLPDVTKKETLSGINSYGKTWHTWRSGMHDGKNDPLPLAPPQLQWSVNYDGEDEPGMVDTRDRRMNLDTGNACRDCQDLVVMAKPQGGVDAMAGMFLNATSPAPGIRDNGDATAKPVPGFGMRAPHTTAH